MSAADPRPVVLALHTAKFAVAGLLRVDGIASTESEARALARAAGYRPLGGAGGLCELAPEEVIGVAGGAWVVAVHA